MSKPTIVARFISTEILEERGRIFYAILNSFSQAGYPIQLISNLTFNSVGEYGAWVFKFPHVSSVDNLPAYTEDKIFLYDKSDKTVLKKKWLKTVSIRFDIFSSYWSSNSILFPYPVHPVHTGPDFKNNLLRLRTSSKSVRLFFSGDMKGYTKNSIKFPEPKIPRFNVINTILEHLPDNTRLLDNPLAVTKQFSGSYANNCVIVDTNKTWIDDKYWLMHLAKTDFFLAPPGIVMPMCHNIIEAMAVGAIPVTNYPEWFSPKLEHLKNCIQFSNKQDLVDKVKFILDMDNQGIKLLRENVIDYYEAYLTNEQFINAFEAVDASHIDIFMIIECYVSRYASQLNRNSFIIKGAAKNNNLWQKLSHLLS